MVKIKEVWIPLPSERGIIQNSEKPLPEKWLRPRPEPGLDWLVSSKFARQRFTSRLERYHAEKVLEVWVSNSVGNSDLLRFVAWARGLALAAGGQGGVQGYLAHKKLPPPQDPAAGLCPGPCGGSTGGNCFLRAKNPCRDTSPFLIVMRQASPGARGIHNNEKTLWS